ncbi:unnamed protein product, partial [marine sediment metagenome]
MKTIPYARQWIDEKDIEAVVEVLRSDIVTRGNKTREFEEKLCEYTGAEYCVAVSSGTAALHLAALVLTENIKNQNIITTPISFVATANAILHSGNKTVFADIEEKTPNIDPYKVKVLSEGSVGLIGVDMAGH